ncbi:MAG: MFS transporter [Planctomycetota bacterium]
MPAKRYQLVFNTFLLSVLLYIDRICISAAKEDITSELTMNDKSFAWILSAFTLGYALMQVPSGWLADRLGPRKMLAMVILLWSLFTGLTGMATAFAAMLIYRFLFGMAEAGAFPGIARACFGWIPMNERGLVNGVNFSGSRIGGALALFFMPWLIEGLGWRNSFYFLAAIGFVFAACWFAWFRDDPQDKASLSQDELDHILANRQQPSSDAGESRLPAGTVLSSGNVWLTMFQYFASNFTFSFCIGWAYPYIKERFALTGVQAGLVAAIPLLCGAAGNWTAGALLDRIYRGGNWVLSRRLPAIVGFALATFGISVFVFLENPYVAIFFLSLAIFGADMTISPSWSFCMDIGREHSGVVSGVMNMAGNIGAFVTVLAFPYMKEWAGGAEPYFMLAAVLNFAAVAAWLAMRPDQPLGGSRAP